MNFKITLVALFAILAVINAKPTPDDRPSDAEDDAQKRNEVQQQQNQHNEKQEVVVVRGDGLQPQPRADAGRTISIKQEDAGRTITVKQRLGAGTGAGGGAGPGAGPGAGRTITIKQRGDGIKKTDDDV